MGPDLKALLEDMIPRVAKYNRKQVTFGALSLDDLEQEMWLAVAEHEQALETQRDLGNTAAIRAMLNRAVTHALRAEEREERAKKALRAGYETQDEIFYSIGLLRRLLASYVDVGVTEFPMAGREQAGGRGTKEEFGDHLVTMIDIDRAFTALPLGKQKLLRKYFSYPQGSGGMTHTEIAFEMGETPTALGSRVHHALKSLQRELGGQNPWNRGPTPRRHRAGK